MCASLLVIDMRAAARHDHRCADLVAAISKASCVAVNDISVFEAYLAGCMHTPERPGERVFLAFFGFCIPESLALLLRAVDVVFAPDLIHASFVGTGKFEAIVQLANEQSLGEAERLFALFKMQIGVVELEEYMSPAMVTCLQRIEAGTHVQGNLHLQRNAHVCSEIKNHAARALPPIFTVVLMVHASLAPALEPASLLLEYEEIGNIFLSSSSIMYTPTHILAAAERSALDSGV